MYKHSLVHILSFFPPGPLCLEQAWDDDVFFRLLSLCRYFGTFCTHHWIQGGTIWRTWDTRRSMVVFMCFVHKCCVTELEILMGTGKLKWGLSMRSVTKGSTCFSYCWGSYLRVSTTFMREGLIAQRMEIFPIPAVHSHWPYIDLGRRHPYLIESIKNPLILAFFFYHSNPHCKLDVPEYCRPQLSLVLSMRGENMNRPTQKKIRGSDA